jgi:hypothetical protein
MNEKTNLWNRSRDTASAPYAHQTPDRAAGITAAIANVSGGVVLY